MHNQDTCTIARSLRLSPTDENAALRHTIAHLKMELRQLRERFENQLVNMQLQPLFAFDGGIYTLADMMQANAHDDELCAWLEDAQIGDVYGGHAPCERLPFALARDNGFR